jgi:hypothetical protein
MTLFLSYSSLAWAQVIFSSATGVVTDPSGAVVPNAKVVLTDVNKGYDYATTTDASGRYLITTLLPSTYRIKVEAPGFRTSIQLGVVVDVAAHVGADIRLEIGASTQSVNVVGAAPILSTQDATTGQEISRDMINNLPLVDRNVLDLAFLAPGVLQAPGAGATPGTGLNFSTNGSRTATTEVLVDGVMGTISSTRGASYQVASLPNLEAVQEFKMMQNNYSAEEGWSNGYINMVMRSGTNQFHGEVYEFLRNKALDSNDWFNNQIGANLPPMRRNQFGGTFGGPIKKNKTFIFADYDGLRLAGGVTKSAGVPSAAERAGDFSELCGGALGPAPGATFNANGMCSNGNGQLWDDYSGTWASNQVVDAAGDIYTGRLTQTFIPFNNMALYQSAGAPALAGTPYQLPAGTGNLINPMAKRFFQEYPLPNVNVGSSTYNPYDNWTKAGVNINTGNQIDVRFDQRFTDRTAFFARYSHGWNGNESMVCYPNQDDPCSTGPGKTPTRGVALELNHTFSPNTIVNASAGFSRNFISSPGPGAAYKSNLIQEEGFPSYLNSDGVNGSPALYVQNYVQPAWGTIGTAPWTVMRQGLEGFHFLSTFTHMQGKHEIKFGGEWRTYQLAYCTHAAGNGLEVYSIGGTAHLDYGPNQGGDSFASFLTGAGGDGEWGEYTLVPHFMLSSHRFGAFIQDNWRATPKLTVNLGFRYDLEIPYTDRFNQDEWFNPTLPVPITGAPVDPATWPSILGPVPHYSDHPIGALQFMGHNPQGYRTIMDTYYKDFGPRVGLAYRLKDKLVVRTGYGVFYNPSLWSSSFGISYNHGFSAVTYSPGTYNQDGYTPWGSLDQPFPEGLNYPTQWHLGPLTNLGESITEPIRYDNAPPYGQTWSGGFQYELPRNWLIDASYVGNKGTHLPYMNSGGIQHFGKWVEQEETNQDLRNALAARVANPFYGVITTPGCGNCGPLIGTISLMLPYPQFTGVNTTMEPIANANYNAFQLKVERRMSNGLSVLASYVISKSLDDSSVGTWGEPGAAGWRDPNDRALEYAASDWDDPQVLQLAYIYQLPFGRGRRWGASWNSVVNSVVGGWQTNGIWRFDKGQPIEISMQGGNHVIDTYGGGDPNCNGQLRLNPRSLWFSEGYFANADQVLSVPPAYTIATCARTLSGIRTPGTRNATLSVFKDFGLNKMREGSKLEFRVESYNALNHPQFGGINTNWNAGGFGAVTSQVNLPREIQMALKLYF